MFAVTVRDYFTVLFLTVEAEFVMVSRNPVTNSSAVVNPLKAQTEEEKRIYSVCQEHQQLRKTMSDESLLKTVPTEAERSLLHQMFLDTLDPHSSTFKVRVKPEGLSSLVHQLT